MAQTPIKVCDFCKEEIRADAIRCKHCGTAVRPATPAHGGTCPYCKEQIKPEAVKCKHCGSSVGRTAPSHGGICPYCKEDINPDAVKCKHCSSPIATEALSRIGQIVDATSLLGFGGILAKPKDPRQDLCDRMWELMKFHLALAILYDLLGMEDESYLEYLKAMGIVSLGHFIDCPHPSP